MERGGVPGFCRILLPKRGHTGGAGGPLDRYVRMAMDNINRKHS